MLNKDPRTTHVVIQEIDTDNWGDGGEVVTALGFDYLDILSLLRAEGTWRIVSKLFTHPAWAPSNSG